MVHNRTNSNWPCAQTQSLCAQTQVALSGAQAPSRVFMLTALLTLTLPLALVDLALALLALSLSLALLALALALDCCCHLDLKESPKS